MSPCFCQPYSLCRHQPPQFLETVLDEDETGRRRRVRILLPHPPRRSGQRFHTGRGECRKSRPNLRGLYSRGGFITSSRVAADGAAPLAPQAPHT